MESGEYQTGFTNPKRTVYLTGCSTRGHFSAEKGKKMNLPAAFAGTGRGKGGVVLRYIFFSKNILELLWYSSGHSLLLPFPLRLNSG
jgi:hypothetical protein